MGGAGGGAGLFGAHYNVFLEDRRGGKEGSVRRKREGERIYTMRDGQPQLRDGHSTLRVHHPPQRPQPGTQATIRPSNIIHALSAFKQTQSKYYIHSEKANCAKKTMIFLYTNKNK